MNSQEIHWRVRLALYPELGQGFSPLNGFLAALILVSVCFAWSEPNAWYSALWQCTRCA